MKDMHPARLRVFTHPGGRMIWKESRCYREKQALASQRRLTSVMLHRCRLGTTPTLRSAEEAAQQMQQHVRNIHTNTDLRTHLHNQHAAAPHISTCHQICSPPLLLLIYYISQKPFIKHRDDVHELQLRVQYNLTLKPSFKHSRLQMGTTIPMNLSDH